MIASSTSADWPSLRVDEWTDTRDTLHMWMQIVGKIRLVCSPLVNHWWQVTTYVTPRGLSTSSIPYGGRIFDIEFDFCAHQLRVRDNSGASREFALEPMSVAQFYSKIMETLASLDITVDISSTPNEVDPAVPFTEDHEHNSYDAPAAHLFWQQLVQADRVISTFRARFIGKVSPVHFFWGSMDLACTRFSGKTAPPHPGGAPNCGDWVMVEGYSHELSSCGFWPGGGEEGAFYSYAYPEPDGFQQRSVQPSAAYFSESFAQFLLPYEAVRTADDPDAALLSFLQSTYDAAAELGTWDRADLESDPSRWADQR